MPLTAMPLPIIRGEQTDGQTDYVDYLPKNLLAVAKAVRGADSYLVSHDGLKQFSNYDVASAYLGDRNGLYNERQNRHFRVTGNSFVTLSPAGVVTEIGIIPGVVRCSFSYSFQSTLVSNGQSAWRFLDSGVVDEMTLPRMAIDSVWISGFYMFTDSEYLFHTNALDEATINPTQYATAEISPDPIVGLLATQDDLLMVFGRFSTQYFYFTGGDNFAFGNISQKAINAGIVGTHAKTILSGDVFILGGRKNESPSFYIVAGGDIKPVSTRTVDKIVAQYTNEELASAVLESRTDERTALLIVRLPSHTLCFNWTFAQAAGFENAWSVLSTGVSNDIWVGCNGVFDPVARKWIYGAINSGKTFELDKINGAHDGVATEYEFQTPIVPVMAKIAKVEIDTITGYSETPQSVFMSISQDGAFFGTEWIEMFPPKGDRGGRYIRNRLGWIPDQVHFKIRALSKGKVNFSRFIGYGA